MSAGFSSLPTFVSLAIALVALNAIALGATVIARSWAQRAGVAGSSTIGAWATAVGALCAVLFAFTIINLWNTFRDADANVDAQAVTVRMVARDMAPSTLPALRSYIAQTIEEWPILCSGGQSKGVDGALANVERSAVPRTPAYGADLYAQLAQLEQLRFTHLRYADERLPRDLWVALGALSLALLAVLALALPESRAYHVALMLVMGTALAVLFWVASLLDYPFCGASSVHPTALMQALHATALSDH